MEEMYEGDQDNEMKDTDGKAGEEGKELTTRGARDAT